MKLQMFGTKSLKTESDLKKVSIPTGSNTPEEEVWSLGEQDALHVPILGSGSNQDEDCGESKPDLLKPFGVYVSEEAKKEAFQLVEENTDFVPTLEEEYDNAIESLQAESIPSPILEESNSTVIGVYASSELYVKSIAKELSCYGDAEIHCFNSNMNESELKDDTEITMWVVNLSDDDEGLLLDSILELSADYPTLYLSGSLSKHCKERIKSFVEGE